MTTAQLLIMLVGGGNLTGMLLNVYGKPAGWAVVLVTQLLFGTYLVVTRQWHGALQFGCAAVALFGFVRWLRRGVHHTGSAEARDRRATDRPSGRPVG